jgi:hypothetical protein
VSNLKKVDSIAKQSVKPGDTVILSEEGKEDFRKKQIFSFVTKDRDRFDLDQQFKVSSVSVDILTVSVPENLRYLTVSNTWDVEVSKLSKIDPSLLTKKTEIMKKKQKYDVNQKVFVPARFADKLPERYVNGLSTREFYEFEIIHKEANSQSSDYFIKIGDLDGGKYEMRISKMGWWMNEDFLLSQEEKNEEEKNLKQKEKAAMTTGTQKTNTSIAEYEKQMKEVRVFDAILSPAIEFSKTCIRYVVHIALTAIGKTNKFVNGAIMMLEDFFEQNKEIADNAVRWILGFLSKNLHHIRKIPVIGEWKALSFLEREDIQRFGIYAQASSEGSVIGDLSTKILGWLQDWIFGSAVAIRISDAITSPEGMMRFVSEMNSEMKGQLAEKLRVEAEATNEAMEAMEDKMQTATA